jgi:hypothetical protein
MRKPILLVSLTALAACSGGGPQTAGGTAVVGGGTTTNNNNNTSNHSFENPTEKKTYSAIGGVQHFRYNTTDRDADPIAPGFQNGQQGGQLYSANASTARNSGITISYDPRDAIFELTIADGAAGVNQNIRFQDPAHRTNFGGVQQPQTGTPNITGKGIQYLEVGSSSGQPGQAQFKSDTSTFFFQKPGTSTKYVTYAGYIRNQLEIAEVTDPNNNKFLQYNYNLDRAAFVFGERTDNANVPKTGTATYTGDMLATMVYNPLFDTQTDAPTYYQWINGSATTNIDFGANSFTQTMTGTVTAPGYDAYTTRTHVLDAGATFAASGHGTIDLVGKGGFAGQMDSASFTQSGTSMPVTIAGSSIDGAFYGPNAQEVGGGYRIVGAVPDQRVDILGSFVGKK